MIHSRKISVNVEAVIQVLGLKRSSKNWYDGTCVFCGKENHMGVIFDEAPSFRCFKCREKGTIIRLLKHINRTDLLINYHVIKGIGEGDIKPNSILDTDLTIKPCILPKSYKRVSYNKYLDSRGFIDIQYNIFGVAIAPLDLRYADKYVLFTVMDNKVPVAVLGRYVLDDKARENHNRMVKLTGKGVKIPKYKNQSAEFGKMLFGIDECIKGVTTTAILVEGVTDKKSIDIAISLYESDTTKCLVTFGKEISDAQICKLLLSSIKNIILFYDPDATNEILLYSKKLYTYFDSVKVVITFGEEDAGEMGYDKIRKEIDGAIDLVRADCIITKNSIRKWKR